MKKLDEVLEDSNGTDEDRARAFERMEHEMNKLHMWKGYYGRQTKRRNSNRSESRVLRAQLSSRKKSASD